MKLTFRDIMRIWREAGLKVTPKEHSEKTPSCLLFARFRDIVEGSDELTAEERLHLESCSYCQRILSVFRERMAIPLAADDRRLAQDRLTSIQEKIGDRLEKIKIKLTEDVHGELAIESETSLWLVLKRGDEFARDFDGCEVEFFLSEGEETGVETIEDGAILIDFERLNISIEEYSGLRFRVKMNGEEIETQIGPEIVEGVHDTAIVGEKVVLGKDVSIGPYVVVGDDTRIGDRTALHAGVQVGRNCKIGEDTVIYPNVALYRNTEVGNRVILHAGAVIGSDGFGFALEDGRYYRIPHVGRVVIENDVEIGANTTIDRAAMGVTRIGRGTKIDNLVQIAHNVVIGENCGIAAQVGIAGSTRIGNGVEIGGQAGFVGHIEIGDGSKIGAQAGVTKSFPAGSVITGYPARDLREMKRIEASETRLPELIRIVREQQKRIEELERGLREAPVNHSTLDDGQIF